MEQNIIKKKLEQYVLAAIVIDSRCVDSLNFINYKNFGVYPEADHQVIFKCISEMFMKKEIDLGTLVYELKTKHQKDYLQYLIEICNYVASTTNVEYHSLLVVQMDFTTKFCNKLDSLALLNSVQLHEKILIAECSKDIRIGDLDIFESIAGFIKMATHKGLSQIIIDECKKFESNILVRVSDIRKKSASTQVLKHLEVMCKTKRQQRLLRLLKMELL